MGQLHSLGDAMFDLRTMIREQRDWIVKTRRELHQIPEPAYTEKKTSVRVADYLASEGLEVQTGIAKYGVVGLMKSGRPGPGSMKESWKTRRWTTPSDAIYGQAARKER